LTYKADCCAIDPTKRSIT